MRLKIKSEYGKSDILVDVRLKKTNQLVILLHGAYGYPFHIGQTKYQFLAKSLSRKYSVAYYQTSRHFQWKDRQDLSFEDYADLSFMGKTFAQELNDVKLAIDQIVDTAIQFNGGHPLEITLVGFSMGGIMSMYVAQMFPNVKNILMFGTAAHFNIPQSKPLFGDFPDDNEIARLAHLFEGSLEMILGLQDDLSSEESAVRLFNYFKKTKSRSLVELNGVDHRFTTINGLPAEATLNTLLYKQIVDSISTLLLM